MEHKLAKQPVFDFDAFRATIDHWKILGAETVIFEWNTGLGPTLFYYPTGNRPFGVKWTEKVPTVEYNELYADYIEYTLVPQLTEIITSRGLKFRAFCADQQPIMVMRMRRREIENAQRASHAY